MASVKALEQQEHNLWLQDREGAPGVVKLDLGRVNEVTYTALLVASLARRDKAADAVLRGLLAGLRADRRMKLSDEVLTTILTPSSGPDLVLVFGAGDSQVGVVVEHKRLGSTHARPLAPHLELPSNFDQGVRVYARSQGGWVDGIWQIDSAFYYRHWLPPIYATLNIVGWVWFDREARNPVAAFQIGDHHEAQSAAEWDLTSYASFSETLRNTWDSDTDDRLRNDLWLLLAALYV